MPLFEFHCNDCNSDFEELLRNVAEASEVVCPACGSARVEKLASSFATVAGGSGHGAGGGSGCSSHGGFS